MRDQLVVDLGPTLVTLSSEDGRGRSVMSFMAFANGISLRSSILHLPAIRDRFIQGVWLLSGATEVASVTCQMAAWIDAKTFDLEHALEGQQS